MREGSWTGMDTELTRCLRESIEDRMDRIQTSLITGNVQTIEDFRLRIGQLRAFREVLDEMEVLKRRAFGLPEHEK